MFLQIYPPFLHLVLIYTLGDKTEAQAHKPTQRLTARLRVFYTVSAARALLGCPINAWNVICVVPLSLSRARRSAERGKGS